MVPHQGVKTKHLDVHNFFVTDKIKRGEVKVAYCLTHNMLADFFTKKSLQGTMFIFMRKKILNLPSITSPAVHRSVLDDQNYEKEHIMDRAKKIN